MSIVYAGQHFSVSAFLIIVVELHFKDFQIQISKLLSMTVHQ